MDKSFCDIAVVVIGQLHVLEMDLQSALKLDLESLDDGTRALYGFNLTKSFAMLRESYIKAQTYAEKTQISGVG